MFKESLRELGVFGLRRDGFGNWANTNLVGDVKKAVPDPFQRCTARRQGATDRRCRKENASSI